MKTFLSHSQALSVKQLINSFEWEKSPLGDQQSWPKNLKTLLSLILNTPVPMVIYWGKTNITLYNDAYAPLIGSKHPALLGRPLIEIWPERKNHFNKIVSAVYQKETIKYTSDYKAPGQETPQTLQKIDITFSPILDDNHQVQGIFSIVTETPAQTLQGVESIEQLIGGLAHDFNTLLGGIIGNLELMKMRIEQNKLDILPRYIDAAQQSATQATSITHQLLAFSRRQTLVPHITDPNHIIQALSDQFHQLAQEILKQPINLQIKTDPNIWFVFCDPEQLKNALIQIFTNACEAIHPSVGQISINSQNVTIAQSHPLRKFLKPDDYIIINIKDNGEGMTPEVINHAIDPFFTTKPLGKRAGLGLSMAYGFAKQSEGHLMITSQHQQGTTISLFLPRYHRPVIIEKFFNDPDKANSPSTLVISDDNHLCMMLSENLEDLGYLMSIAQTKKEVFTLLKGNINFSFVIIDTRLLIQPESTLIAEITKDYPDLPILFITGYEDNPPVHIKKLVNDTNFVIRKPLTHALLANQIGAIETLRNYRLV
ncbi:PAS domain-containing hybrid sensor histidine kinase/response regulator [Commensalibacter oyaizuii]|uniref:histidine kinase n=1 Tax=Commensalibacter oyaizuii TaxID=3043873 RepID=A0ABT6Q1R3_9PROT|nr:PAS domain-containing hybrid sensor histidine kinase/response regulator [Commensalibacter sp. TBRC 16381]MDI2091052.1 ATP-binding protein [Commensalibacter sp. TBRC 16381]